jgi:phosphoglycerate dehydrogenase-like enzyme
MSEGEWPKNSYRGIELHGKTLGVIGFGHIGSRVAQLASALGMNVSVYTRTHSQSRKDSIEAIGGRELSMDDLIRTSDFITLHVPLSDDTKNLFSAETFRKMKPISYLINTSRGAVVDEQALIFALENGIIAGAALDVFAEEPLQKDNPLCKMKSVILSPHVAANSREAEERASSMISVDIDRVLQGKAALHAV